MSPHGHCLGLNVLPKAYAMLWQTNVSKNGCDKKNVAAIALLYGNGQTGYLDIMMLKALYIQCFNKCFVIPINPDKNPNDIPSNASTQQWSFATKGPNKCMTLTKQW